MEQTDFYSNAHLVVAAIRVLEHQKSAVPTVESVSRLLDFSLEQGSFFCRQLQELAIIKCVESPYGLRLFIENHLKLEEIPRGEQDSRLEKELARFQSSRRELDRKIKSFQTEQARKQKDLFAELDKKLKSGLSPKSTGSQPADDK